MKGKRPAVARHGRASLGDKSRLLYHGSFILARQDAPLTSMLGCLLRVYIILEYTTVCVWMARGLGVWGDSLRYLGIAEGWGMGFWG